MYRFDNQQVYNLMHSTIENDVNFFYTADVYPNGWNGE